MSERIREEVIKICKAWAEVQVDEKISVKDYDRNQHMQKIGVLCEAIHKECTKMSLVFSKPPMPTNEELDGLLHGVAICFNMLLSWYRTYPLTEGIALHAVLKACLLDIKETVCNLLECFAVSAKADQRVAATGKVWNACDRFKLLPRDNCCAFRQELEVSMDLVSDALQEVKDESVQVNDDLDNEESWTAEEKLLVAPVVGVLMVCKGLLKKIKYSPDLQALSTSQVDRLKEFTDDISPCVDDLVMSLYHPISKSSLWDQANSVKDALTPILDYLRSCDALISIDNDLDFLEKALHHNLEKLKSLIS